MSQVIVVPTVQIPIVVTIDKSITRKVSACGRKVLYDVLVKLGFDEATEVTLQGPWSLGEFLVDLLSQP